VVKFLTRLKKHHALREFLCRQMRGQQVELMAGQSGQQFVV
jgi:hypothetical protein